jgi:CubicO group peptidase (beta-lactamase class C family)
MEQEKQSPDIPGPGAGQHPALNRIIRLCAGAPLARRPGTAMIYSNIGYLLLSDMVRRVSASHSGNSRTSACSSRWA